MARSRSITGAAGGLGRVAAELFAREGCRVVIADLLDAGEAVEAINASGAQAVAVPCDVADDGSVRAAIAAAMETYGALHILYNNAGVSPAADDGPVETDDDTWTTVLDINVTGVARCCRHGIPGAVGVGRRVHRERSVVRGAHGRGNATDRVHVVEGCRRCHDP